MSRFDQFKTEQIRTEREFLIERNCFQHDAKPENLACHRLSLVISFIIDCSQSPIFPFDRRDRAQTAVIFVFKQQVRTGESDITIEWVGGVPAETPPLPLPTR